MGTFKTRLDAVLHGRRLNPWCKAHGLSKGTAGRMIEGQTPGPEILSLIMRIENVSITWLLEGIGAPFLVSEYTDGYADILQEWLDYGGRPAYIVTDRHDAAVILVQPAQHEYRGKTIDYSAIQITHGNIKASEIDVINRFPEIYLKPVSSAVLDAIKRGDMGTWQLLGDMHHPGLLSDAELIDSITAADIGAGQRVAEAHSKYHHSDDIADRFSRLNAHDQESISMIIDALLAKQKP